MLHKNIMEQLKTLKFKGMIQGFDEIIKPENEVNLSVLSTLLKNEISYRQARSFMYRLELAKLPQIKSIDNFDATDLPLDREAFADACGIRFIDDFSNVLIIGGSGTGKTHLAIGLAHAVLHNGYRIRFYKFMDLAKALVLAADGDYLPVFIARLQRFNLLVIDEFGYLPIDPKANPLFFELFSSLYENTSVIMTTHLTFTEWPEIFGNVKATKAIIDRFTHHCLVLETGNKSWRLKESRRKK